MKEGARETHETRERGWRAASSPPVRMVGLEADRYVLIRLKCQMKGQPLLSVGFYDQEWRKIDGWRIPAASIIGWMELGNAAAALDRLDPEQARMRPGEMPLKAWLEEERVRLAAAGSGKAIYHRLLKGEYPHLKLRRVNKRVVFVDIESAKLTAKNAENAEGAK